MRFLFKYATRGRPDWFRKTITEYTQMLSRKQDCQWIISADIDDAAMNNTAIQSFVAQFPKMSIHYGNNVSKIAAINADMDKASPFDILFVVSDDMSPKVKDFDVIIARDMLENFPNFDGALHYNDGFCGKDKTITLTIMGRELYKHFGYIYHPEYKSFYCDNEFTDVVTAMGKRAYIDKIIVKHEYKGFGNQPDAVYQMNSAKGRQDAQIYAQRKQQGFPT